MVINITNKLVSNWECPDVVQKRDKYKMLCAWEQGYSVIRLLQTEVLTNQVNLETELIRSYENPMVYCLYKNNDEKYNLYSIFYEDYMLNPLVTLDLSESEKETDVERNRYVKINNPNLI